MSSSSSSSIFYIWLDVFRWSASTGFNMRSLSPLLQRQALRLPEHVWVPGQAGGEPEDEAIKPAQTVISPSSLPSLAR